VSPSLMSDIFIGPYPHTKSMRRYSSEPTSSVYDFAPRGGKTLWVPRIAGITPHGFSMFVFAPMEYVGESS